MLKRKIKCYKYKQKKNFLVTRKKYCGDVLVTSIYTLLDTSVTELCPDYKKIKRFFLCYI